MIFYIRLEDVLRLHELALDRFGGLSGIRDKGALESALAQPEMSFGGEDLYPSIFEKASALGYSLVRNHPFLDGNKRTALMAMGVFLDVNGFRLEASNDEAYDTVIQVANGSLDRGHLAKWLRESCTPN